MKKQQIVQTIGAILLVLSVLLGEAGCAGCSERGHERQTEAASDTRPTGIPGTREPDTGREDPTEADDTGTGPAIDKPSASCDHTYSSTAAPAACTTDGYTLYTCTKCGDGYVDDWIKASGHIWGEWTVTTPADCYTCGEKTRQCTVCGQTDTGVLNRLSHEFVSDGTCEKDGDTYSVYTCVSCGHTELTKGEETPNPATQDFVYNCGNDFSFTVSFDGTEDELRRKLTIVEVQAEGTEYDQAGAAQADYTLTGQRNGTWLVSPTGSYANGTRYAARLTDDSVSFDDYSGSRLNFTTVRTADQNVVRFNDKIIFLKALERDYPGYYPYETTEPDENGTVYVTVGRADHLKAGDLLCLGNYLSYTEIIEQNAGVDSYYIGKITAILPQHGAYILVMDEPSINEVYDELDVELCIDWERMDEAMDEEAQAQLDNMALNAILDDDEFLTYLVSMEKASVEYLDQRDLTPMWEMMEFNPDSIKLGDYFVVSCSAKLMNYSEFKNSDFYQSGPWDSLNHHMTSNGRDVVLIADAELTGTLPFKSKSENAKGKLTATLHVQFIDNTVLNVRFKTSSDSLGSSVGHLWGESGNKITLELGLHCGFEYTAHQEEMPFVKNEKTGTYHCAYCRIVEQNKKTSTFQKLKAGQMGQVVKGHMDELDDAMFCGVCKPQYAILSDYLMLNPNSGTLHVASCYHVMANAEPVRAMAAVLEKQGYSCCKDCDPKGKQGQYMAELITAKMTAGGMEDELQKLKDDLKGVATSVDKTTADKSDKKHIVSFEFPVVGPVGIYVQFDFVFDFNFNGKALYRNACEETTQFDGEYVCVLGPISYFRMNRCDTTGKRQTQSELILEGTISARLGGEISFGVYCVSKKALSFGLYVEAGLYADMNGYFKADLMKNEWLGGARFEAGVYVEAGLEGRLIFYDWEFPFFDWEKTKKSLVNYGYDEIWTSFATTPAELEIRDDLTRSDAYNNREYRDAYKMEPGTFLKINTFDLKKMEGSQRTLEFGSYLVYTARIEENNDYFDVVNGIFCVKKKAPTEFTGSFKVIVETKTDWSTYKSGSAVSYLTAYTVNFHYKGEESVNPAAPTGQVQIGDFLIFGAIDEINKWQVINIKGNDVMILNTMAHGGEFDASIHMVAIAKSLMKYISYGSATWEYSDARQFLNNREENVFTDTVFSYDDFGFATVSADNDQKPYYTRYEAGYLSDAYFSEEEYWLIDNTEHYSLIPIVQSGSGSVFIKDYPKLLDQTLFNIQQKYGADTTVDRMFILNGYEFSHYVEGNGLCGFKGPEGLYYPSCYLRDSVADDFIGFYTYYGTHAASVYKNKYSAVEADSINYIRPACYLNFSFVESLDGSGSYDDPYILTIDHSVVGRELNTVQDFPQELPEDVFEWNDHHYAVFNNCALWGEAEEYCLSLGGHLATLTSAEENEAVYQYILSCGYTTAYFGYCGWSSDNITWEWEWINGETSAYTNWHKGEPAKDELYKPHARFCEQSDDGTWSAGYFVDHSTNDNNVFICEWD